MDNKGEEEFEVITQQPSPFACVTRRNHDPILNHSLFYLHSVTQISYQMQIHSSYPYGLYIKLLKSHMQVLILFLGIQELILQENGIL